MKYTAKLPQINDNVSPESPLRELFILLGGLLAVIAAVYLMLGWAVDWVAGNVSLETEKKIAGYFSDLTRSAEKSSRRVDYLQTLTDALCKQCAHIAYPVRIYVYEQDIVNAVALPGGTIIVFSGLLEKIQSENELVFVIGHELGHFRNRDHLRVMGRRMVFLVLSVLLMGSDDSVGGMLADSAMLSELRFSRKQELRADEFGTAVAGCYYGHIGGAADFFEKMKQSEDPSRFGQYFASHPDADARIRNILEYGRANHFATGEKTDVPVDLLETDPTEAVTE